MQRNTSSEMFSFFLVKISESEESATSEKKDETCNDSMDEESESVGKRFGVPEAKLLERIILHLLKLLE